MKTNKFDICKELRDKAKSQGIQLFYDIDGGFRKKEVVNLENTSGNLGFLIRQEPSFGAENTYFAFVLFDYETQDEIPVSGFYVKNYTPNIIDKKTGYYVQLFSLFGNQITSAVYDNMCR